MGGRVPRGALIATLVGNTLEFYDFITYAFLAVYIGKAFFPTDSAFASLLLSVATFGVGFLTRPVGGVIIGAYADRVGRRPPIAAGLVLIPIGLYMRRALPETLHEPKHTSAGAALATVWRDHRREIILLVLMTAASTVMTYIGNYMTTFSQKTLGMSPTVALLAPIANGALWIFVSPIGGWACERFGRRQTYFVSRVLGILVIVPAFLYLIHARTTFSLLTSVVVMSLASLPSTIAGQTVMAEVFPAASRSAGIALAYASSVTIFGATTQFVITWLLELTHDPLAPAYYGIGMMIVGLVAGAFLFRTMRSRADE